jgi:hypothetical protein
VARDQLEINQETIFRGVVALRLSTVICMASCSTLARTFLQNVSMNVSMELRSIAVKVLELLLAKRFHFPGWHQ